MIDNPELAQSYILLSVLRQQRDRLSLKAQHIPKLNEQVVRLEQQLKQRIQQNEQAAGCRKAMLQALEAELRAQVAAREQAKQYAESIIMQLRRNTAQMRKMSVEGLELQKQIQADSLRIQQLLQQIDQTDLLIKQEHTLVDEKASVHSLMQQVQTGKLRVRSMLSAYDQLRNQAAHELSASFYLQQEISHQSTDMAELELQSETASNQLYNVKIGVYKLEEQLQEKKARMQNLWLTLTNTQKNSDVLQKQQLQQQNQIAQLQSKLQECLNRCQQMSGELVTISAKADNIERDNKLNNHKIECVLMLIKRLHAQRDQLIVMRRNNLGRSDRTSTSGRRMLGGMSRAQIRSEASISLNSSRPVGNSGWRSDLQSSEHIN